MPEVVFALITAFFAFGTVVSVWGYLDGDIAPAEAVWWPLVLAKWLLKSLWTVLFTGWR